MRRRTFLAALAAGPVALSAQEPGGPRGMISRQKSPDNLEFPFSSLRELLTPTDQFFVRSHFDMPTIDAADWRLKVEGDVERAREFSLEQLQRMESRTVTALLECSGNSRVFLKPQPLGLRWEQGGVGTAEWTGVPLSAVLAEAGLKSDVTEIIFEGADRGKIESPQPKSPGVIPFARSLPRGKAEQPEVLLAYAMNGKPLPSRHGFPLRLVVPGWYGMASIKWLRRIVATRQPFQGYFQTLTYTIWEPRHGLPSLVPVTALRVKSQISRPTLHEVVPKGAAYRVFGAAWTGDGEIAKVDVSTDGKTWSAAKLLDEPVKHAWRLWEYEWKPTQPGPYTLRSRATDSEGQVQPLERDENLRDAVITHVQPITLEVR